MDDVTATVELMHGIPVLNDPTALGVIQAIDHHNRKIDQENLQRAREGQAERIQYFLNRMDVRGDDPQDIMIVIFGCDDPVGREFAEVTMPGQESTWQNMRDAGLRPYARGLYHRAVVTEGLGLVYPEVAAQLEAHKGRVGVIVDFNSALPLFFLKSGDGRRKGLV